MAAPFSDGVFYDGEEGLYKMWYHAGWFDGDSERSEERYKMSLYARTENDARYLDC